MSEHIVTFSYNPSLTHERKYVVEQSEDGQGSQEAKVSTGIREPYDIDRLSKNERMIESTESTIQPTIYPTSQPITYPPNLSAQMTTQPKTPKMPRSKTHARKTTPVDSLSILSKYDRHKFDKAIALMEDYSEQARSSPTEADENYLAQVNVAAGRLQLLRSAYLAIQKIKKQRKLSEKAYAVEESSASESVDESTSSSQIFSQGLEDEDSSYSTDSAKVPMKLNT